MGYLIGIIIALAIIIPIIIAIVTVAAYAAAVILGIVLVLGVMCGTYKAILCYGTAVKRTYGHDPHYVPRGGLKALAVCMMIFIPIITLIIYLVSTLVSAVSAYPGPW